MCKKVVEGRYVIYRIYLVSRLYGRVNSSCWGKCYVYVICFCIDLLFLFELILF